MQLPTEVFQAIATFLAAGKSGKITLSVKSGEVERWELTEAFSRRSQRREWVDSGGAAGVFPGAPLSTSAVRASDVG